MVPEAYFPAMNLSFSVPVSVMHSLAASGSDVFPIAIAGSAGFAGNKKGELRNSLKLLTFL